MRYLFAEVSHGYLLEEDEQLYSEKQRRVTTFMKTPRELEKVCYMVWDMDPLSRNVAELILYTVEPL